MNWFIHTSLPCSILLILRPREYWNPSQAVDSAFVVGGEDTLARRRGGWGVNILEDERDRIALLQ